jgi:hypothetical protein
MSAKPRQGIGPLAHGVLQALAHVVQRAGQAGDLVAAHHLHPVVELAVGQPARGPLQVPQPQHGGALEAAVHQQQGQRHQAHDQQ